MAWQDSTTDRVAGVHVKDLRTCVAHSPKGLPETAQALGALERANLGSRIESTRVDGSARFGGI